MDSHVDGLPEQLQGHLHINLEQSCLSYLNFFHDTADPQWHNTFYCALLYSEFCVKSQEMVSK